MRKVYFSLVLVVLIRLALLWFNACAEMARHSVYIGLDFSCVGSGIKEPEFYGSLLEHTVQVQTVVSALMVMPVSAIPSPVPDVADFLY